MHDLTASTAAARARLDDALNEFNRQLASYRAENLSVLKSRPDLLRKIDARLAKTAVKEKD